MDYETIAVEREGALMTVRFNRPHKRNAINRQMHAELQDLCHALTDETGTRVVIFTGAGTGFSSGADISEWTESQSADELAVRHISGHQPQNQAGDQARRILRERFARGEIDQTELETRLRVLDQS